MTAADRIVVALDVPDVSSALLVIEQTHEYVGWYKVGLELICGQSAAKVISWIKHYKAKVFYDAKLNDIPTTVSKSVKAARELGVDLINVHALAGVEAMQAAVEATGTNTMIAAVTVLTSMNFADLEKLGFNAAMTWSDADALGSIVARLARLAHEARVPGLICSPKDLEYLKDLSDKFVKITPGVRPTWAVANDQKRIMTPGDAIRSGADMVVVGRPIVSPPEGKLREEAARDIHAEIDGVLQSASGS